MRAKTVICLAVSAWLAWAASGEALPGGRTGRATTQEKPAAPAGHGGMMGLGGAPAPAAQKVTGTVLETISASSYTYLRLRTSSGEEWAAVDQSDAKVGSTVTVLVSMTAENFESKALKRTFPKLIMGSLVAPGAASAGDESSAAAGGALLSSHGSAPGAQGAVMPPGHPAVGADSSVTTPVKPAPKAEGADGRTVAEVWKQRAALAGGRVAVRGTVVKFLGGIMGKNWLHLRDGSGSAATGDEDITVTTAEFAAVGDVVLVKGLVKVDQDFGAGYRYPVIIEDASVAK
jgi:hypothetical protein